MKVRLQIDKSAQENAALYYERSKKAKRKTQGLLKAIEETKKELLQAERKEELAKESAPKKRERRERDWYEKFHWFISSDGFLVICGRDMRSNQTIVKKHMAEKDAYLHADIQGAASTVVVSEGKPIPERTMQEAAQFAGTFSKAFSLGLGAVDVYSVSPEHVKLAAKAGEFLPKGGFVIEGKRQWFRSVELRLAVCYDAGKKRPYSCPPGAAKGKHAIVRPGKAEKGELALKVKKLLGIDCDLQDIVQILPPGSGELE